jgi:hypothetical protein
MKEVVKNWIFTEWAMFKGLPLYHQEQKLDFIIFLCYFFLLIGLWIRISNLDEKR